MDQFETAAQSAGAADSLSEAPRNQVLQALGERVRNLRSRRGMTRRALAAAADVSERHLANLEYGTGNVSVLVLHHIAQALQCSMAELLGDVTTTSAEWLLIRELLEGRDEEDLRRVRRQAMEVVGQHGSITKAEREVPLLRIPVTPKTGKGRRR